MAPTKPLVAQQIDACTSVMPLPREDLSEMTGQLAPAKVERERERG
jgi:ERCC4-related helicase